MPHQKKNAQRTDRTNQVDNPALQLESAGEHRNCALSKFPSRRTTEFTISTKVCQDGSWWLPVICLQFSFFDRQSSLDQPWINSGKSTENRKQTADKKNKKKTRWIRNPDTNSLLPPSLGSTQYLLMPNPSLSKGLETPNQ